MDDDPTGTQMASGVTVLLSWSARRIADVLGSEGALYVQTNSRALEERDAVALAEALHAAVAAAEQALARPVRVVLRGDSTLRGHVFAETNVFAGGSSPVLFVPAFPQGGRTTMNSVHYAVVDGMRMPVGETEFAQDPVFGFSSSNLVDWVREKGKADGLEFPVEILRATEGHALAELLVDAPAGAWVVPDAQTDNDISLIHAALQIAEGAGRAVVTRCAATLAALCAGVLSTSLLARPIDIPNRNNSEGKVLVICGSHTGASTRQLTALCERHGVQPVQIPTDDAFADAQSAGAAAANRVLAAFESTNLAVLSTERQRRAGDDSLVHGELVMRALMSATSTILRSVRTVVSKGGITSAEVARVGFGATEATVRGQVAPGISVWDLHTDTPATQVVVPGNVGDTDALIDVVEATGLHFASKETPRV
ncbi:four-carbon acid sugar kinase family protein [Mycolicibacterium goodii]|uniref:four-carbon acid sugar kinase family protein n=1 Tax=Mycolicibacterium goodii TaxID=134601 RepID=UPI0018EBC334|nr:four-carbon acid sugar kinase family protein [Mycolicibacterium goodii]